MKVLVHADGPKVFWFQCGDFTAPAAQVADGDIESVKFSSLCGAQPETGVCHGLPVVISRGDLRCRDALTCSSCSFLAFGEAQIAELSPTGVTEDKKGLLVSAFVEEVGLHCTCVSRGRVTRDETLFLVQLLSGIKC